MRSRVSKGATVNPGMPLAVAMYDAYDPSRCAAAGHDASALAHDAGVPDTYPRLMGPPCRPRCCGDAVGDGDSPTGVRSAAADDTITDARTGIA